MNELNQLNVCEMREGLLRGDFSAQELTSAHLQRIAETNKLFNSFVLVAAENANNQAAKADEVLKAQKENSPFLTGIPIAIKDMLVTEGIETTCCSKILKGFIPPYDGTAVAHLKKNGAVILGKTNLDEFAMGSSNENSAFGPVRNPWDIERVPGGSSGGSAAAVSLGQAPFALGTDTGGSIRQPASLTGTVGLKPTYGRVSRYGAVAYASSLDQIGPIARSVEDVATLLETISGSDPLDSTSMDVPVPCYRDELLRMRDQGLRGLRIGLPKEYFIPGTDAEVEQSVQEGVKVLKNLGAEIVEISLPHTEFALATYYIIALAEASSNLARYDGVRFGPRAEGVQSTRELYEHSRAMGFGAEVKRRILIGTYVLSAGYYDAYYRKAQQIRTLIINDFKSVFANKCDLIVAPTSPTTAFKLNEKTDSPLHMYLADVFTVPINLAGVPALSVPCGVDSKNLPIGLQLIAAPFQESSLLRVGDAFLREKQFDTAAKTRQSYP